MGFHTQASESKRKRRNDDERHTFCINDEGIYRMMMRQMIRSEMEWVRKHRHMIDEVMDNVESGRKPAHYLAYPVK